MRYIFILFLVIFLSLLSVVAIASAKVYPLMYERNWYADEVVFTKADNQFGTTGTLKTKWGTLLADNVTWYLTEEQTMNLSMPVRSRINYISIDSEWIAVDPVLTTNYSAKDGNAYAKRIASYINMRQLSEVCTAKDNQLRFIYPDARSSGFSLVWNLHSQYPYVHVVNQSYGYSFEKP